MRVRQGVSLPRMQKQARQDPGLRLLVQEQRATSWHPNHSRKLLLRRCSPQRFLGLTTSLQLLHVATHAKLMQNAALTVHPVLDLMPATRS